MRRALATALLALTIVACDDEDPTEVNDTVTVNMTDFAFSPATVTIEEGETVRWNNNGAVQHNSTGANNAWSSGNINPGQGFSRTFENEGTFQYTCTLHPGMSGTVIVE